MIKTRAGLRLAFRSFAIAAALTIATPAYAQTTSTVRGHVEGASAGSTVTVTDLNTGHTDTAKTDASGNYIIVGLAPSTYRVQSGRPRKTVVVPLGQAVTVDLAAPATAAAAAGRNRGGRSSDEGRQNSGGDDQRLAVSNREFAERRSQLPQFRGARARRHRVPPTLGGKARQVQAGAISSDNTNTFIDGISIKNLVNHGGTIGQNYLIG